MLVLDGLHAHYGSAHVLHGVSLEVETGQIACLIGRNGAGKSTTLKAIMGVVRPSAGQIIFKNERIDARPPYQIAARGLAWVPEDRRVFASLSVEENIRVASQALSGSSRRRTDDALAFFADLRARATQRAGSLSGGQQQVLAIARALASGPDLIMLDEPSEGLSPTMIAAIRAGILECRSRGVSILLVEQNLALALAIGELFFVISRGAVVHRATRDQVLSNPNILIEHLGVTAMKQVSKIA
jgi:branched-chain amino acid transport system ATP-binding protein